MLNRSSLGFLTAAALVFLSCSKNGSNPAMFDLPTTIAMKMTVPELIGQMLLPDVSLVQNASGQIDPSMIAKYHLGGVLPGANSFPNADGTGFVSSPLTASTLISQATLENWQNAAATLQASAINADGHLIGLLLGTDAVHGNQHVLGNVLFPHNIGLGATHDANLMRAIAQWTAYDVRQSGFNWAYAPTLAVAQNYKWGRTYESYSSDPNLVKSYAQQFVDGLQGTNSSDPLAPISGVLATAKHYIGDGATNDGWDEGFVKDVGCSAETGCTPDNAFLQTHFAGYAGAIDSGVGSVMVSYSSVCAPGDTSCPSADGTSDIGVRMSIHKGLLTNVLRDGQNPYNSSFSGLVVSDYGAIDKISNDVNFKQDLINSLNSGVEMFMISPFGKGIEDHIAALQQGYNEGKVSLQTMQKAVIDILRVKQRMGLLDSPEMSQPPVSPESNEKTIALEAAQKSLVLLKNDNLALPVNKSGLQYIVFAGQRNYTQAQPPFETEGPFYSYDDIGQQNGGWTLRWQGMHGNSPWRNSAVPSDLASSIVDGVANAFTSVPDNQKPNLVFVVDNVADCSAFTGNAHFSIPPYNSFPTVQCILPSALSGLGLTSANSVMISAFGEHPYAEFNGDVANGNPLYNIPTNPYYLPNEQRASLHLNFNSASSLGQSVEFAKTNNIRTITVLLSGRPMVVDSQSIPGSSLSPFEYSTAFIAAWLPGTEGGNAIANAIFGDYQFKNCGPSVSCNTLPFTWPGTTTSFPVGYGLGDPPPPGL